MLTKTGQLIVLAAVRVPGDTRTPTAVLQLPLGLNLPAGAKVQIDDGKAVDMPVQVRVTTQGPTRVVACHGQGTDLSCGGLAVTAEIDLPIGAQIGVEFIPPYSDQPITFRGFVRNGDGIRYGVEFITENDDDYRKTGELQEGLAAMNAKIT